jgi:regulator of sirC expression with transglutaminase-like and TPR domain
MPYRLFVAILFLLALVIHVPAADPKTAEKTVEQLTEAVRKSVVVIQYTGRDGKRHGLGSGFIISSDGLIATNFHVIGEARPITVVLPDGSKHEVSVVHATDRNADLAVIKIDAKELPALDLGDSDALKQGQSIVALGAPKGLEYSVVSGVVSGRRDIEGQSMIQLAVPIEPGNSGGPLLDMQGRVHGILTLKSLVTENLGFAEPINALKPLLKKPNPIPMSSWLTIGALDSADWKPLFGARWTQRAGRLLVEGPGSGFGGRSLCLWQHETPELPFELTVTVKLDDEAGAAGLAWHADGENRHYGFYPTGGKLRLVRFDGPDVLSWKILTEEISPHYKPGEWNVLKVRLEKEKIRCYVNDQLAIESTDTGLSEGKAGLVKFRDTKAEFKRFQVGAKVGAGAVPADVTARVGKTVEGLTPQKPIKPDVVDTLKADAPASLSALRERARMLDLQAAQLRKLAVTVHQKRVQADLVKVLDGKEEDVDLLHAALLIALLDNDEVDVEAYRREVDRMGRDILAGLRKDADEQTKLKALNKFLFEQRGFHGSRGDYYHKSNSYLNEVIDDREGLPITLSVLYLELGKRLGLKIEGVGLPGHFVVKLVPAKGEDQLIDVFEGGVSLSREEAAKRVKAMTGGPLKEGHLATAKKRAIVVRMLQNLMNLADRDHDEAGLLRYLDAIVTVQPEAADERWMRAVLRYRAGEMDGAREDVDWLLEKGPEGLDRDRVLELKKLLK